MRKKVKNISLTRLCRRIGWSSVGVVGVIGLMMCFPVVGDSSSALGEDVSLTASLNTKTTAYLYSTIAIATSGEIDINLIPKSNGALEVGTADVTVATNNTTGYSILLSTVDQTNKLNQKDKGAQYTGSTEDYAIEALPGKVTKANYLNSAANLNTWGYALTTGQANDNTEYQGLSTSTGETVYSTNGTSSRDSYKLNVAVAVDTSLPAGGYQNGLVVTAVANPIIVSGFNQIYYMQDMTPAICASAEMESTAQLIDKRDNKIYWVAKLKDGNCWMTQNLALDLDVNVEGTAVAVAKNGNQTVLNETNTDITNVWNERAPSKTETIIPEAITTDTDDSSETGDTGNSTTLDYAEVRSWDLGQVVLTNPTGSSACGNIASGGEITDCKWYTDVSNGWSANYRATKNSSVDEASQAYDAHYLIGNYYQWSTVTAGTGYQLTSLSSATTDSASLRDAGSSICPSGWQMPTSGRYSRTNDGEITTYPYEREKSYMSLMTAYGYPSGSDTENEWKINDSSNNPYVSLNYSGSTRPDYDPIYFTRTGLLGVAGGQVRYAGTGVYAWSNTASTYNVTAYFFFFNTVNLRPAYTTNRTNGLTVRCVAK